MANNLGRGGGEQLLKKMSNQAMSYCLKNNLEEIPALAEAFELFAETYKIPDRAVFQVNLSLDELLTNTISYGFPEGGEHEIVIRIALQAVTLVIEVKDDGMAFNPLETSEVDIGHELEDRPVGGLGIHLARKMMDEIEYNREENHNVLVMRKQIQDV